MILPINPVSVLGSLTETPASGSSAPGSSFEKYLGQALDGVNNLQVESATLNNQLAAGQLDNLHQAMIVAEKASLAMQLTIELRNKVIDAYQDIMRIQV